MNFIENIWLANVEQSLIETMADFLDDECLIMDESCAGVKDREPREKSELHIRMAKAAFSEYKKTMLNEGTETTRTNF